MGRFVDETGALLPDEPEEPTQGEKPSSASSSAKATEDRQGEARAGSRRFDMLATRVERVLSGLPQMSWHATTLHSVAGQLRAEQREYDAALSSPQEGATAVGGYTAEQIAESRRCLRNDSDKRFQIADDVIEALQGRVEEWKDACQAYSNTVTRLNERAETAESSLRTLGDALERARVGLESIRDCAEPREHPEPDDADWRFVALEMKRVARVALTPPTRDTSCEAVAKQEPVTPSASFRDRVERRMTQILDDERKATPSSPLDKGTDE